MSADVSSRHYVYAVVDKRTTPDAPPRTVEFSRRAAREWIKQYMPHDAPYLRVRRAALTIFAS